MDVHRKFEILEMIAKGGMAEVYKARTVGAEGFAKEVCVKKILPHLTEDDQFVTMFINEAKLAATLSYANIVHVYDLCVSADHEYFIVMEYVHGKDLSEIIRAAQLADIEIPIPVAVYIAREVAKGLHYAHTKMDSSGIPLNIIHRDISPQNILVAFAGEVKITDFGIAKASFSMSKTAVGVLKGKYGYMSPEQARGEPLDARSDVFNLGIVLYEMLVGERCFAGASDYSTLNLMRDAVVTPPSSLSKRISKELETLVMKALAREPKDRFRDALVLESNLGAFAAKTKEARSSDVARFLHQLFSAKTPESAKAGSSTQVLALESLVGPPASPDQNAAHAIEPAVPRAPLGSEEQTVLSRSQKPKGEDETPPANASIGDLAASVRSGLTGRPAEAGDGLERRPAAQSAAEGHPGSLPSRGGSFFDRFTEETKRGLSRHYLGAATVIVLAGLSGAVFGVVRAQLTPSEAVLRAQELPLEEPMKEPNAISVVITTEPPGATVWLDKSELAQTTPLAVERVRDERPHDLAIEHLGHQRSSSTFRYEPGPVTLLHAKLSADPGVLAVRTRPPNLPVKVDGKLVGTSPLKIDLPAGDHRVEVEGPGLSPLSQAVRVASGQESLFDRTLFPPGQGTQVAFVTRPTSRVWIDGTDTGLYADGSPHPLEPGIKHLVRLVNDDQGIERALSLELAEGEQRTLVLELTPLSQAPTGPKG